MGSRERWFSTIGGGALAAYGLTRRRSLGGVGMTLAGSLLAYRGVTGHCPGYEAAGLNSTNGSHNELSIRRTVRINRPREEVYRFWRNFENFPKVMGHIESVVHIDGDRSHWVATPVRGVKLQWDAVIIEERENEALSWRSLPDSTVYNEGSIYFKNAPSGWGTELEISIRYRAPGGILGAAAGSLLSGLTRQQVERDLQQAKRFLEAGEAVEATAKR